MIFLRKRSIDISLNETERELYEMREKALRDRINALDSAKLEGKLEGRLEEKKEIARKLLDVLDNDTIATKTGLSKEEVQDLR